LLRWLAQAKPDVVALQELKASDAEFPRAAIAAAGYGAVWCGQRTWNGVALLARGSEPIAGGQMGERYACGPPTVRSLTSA